MYSTYSFNDTSLVLTHPNVGQKVFKGTGMGSVALSRAADMSAQDLSADGSVMISKIETKNGAIQITIQQTSDAQLWLKKWVNYLRTSPTSEYALTTGMLKNDSTGECFTLNGVVPQKNPDSTFQQTGQQVTWSLMVAEILDT